MVELSHGCVVTLALGWALAAVLALVLAVRRFYLWDAERRAEVWAARCRELRDYRDAYYDLLAGKGVQPPGGLSWLAKGPDKAHRLN